MPVLTDKSLRLQILEYIRGLYLSAVDNPDPPTGQKHYGVAFSQVVLGPLSREDNRKRFSIGIIPGRELKSDLYPLKSSMFDVTIEFRITVNKDDGEPMILAEQVMAIVQQIMMDDDTLGGLVIKSDEIGNEQDMFTHADKAISGMTQFRIHYRHGNNTVYDGMPV